MGARLIKMNILLIYPKPNISFDTTHCVPLGLAYIAAVLQSEGHTLTCLDLNVQQDNLEQLAKENSVVGIYTKTPTIKSVWKLCERIKNVNPAALTVLGGPHPSAMVDECLSHNCVDVVVRGEGEYTMRELCDFISKNKSIKSVKGISYKKDNKLIHNPARDKIQNLDELPYPAYDLFPVKAYSPTRPTWIDKNSVVPISMVSSRGCPFVCNFCFSQQTGFRGRSPEKFVEEVKFLVDKYKINFIELQDDVFNLIPSRSMEICNLLIKENLDVKWSIPNGISRVEKVSREFLELCKKSGCIDTWFAAESGSERIRQNFINKMNTLQQVKDAIRTAKDVGFQVGAFFVLGHPDETKDEMQGTIDLAKSLPLDRAQFTIATPFPGTKLFDMIKQNGKFLITDWDFYGPYENAVFFEYGNMKKEIVEEMYKKAYRSFYLRPSYIAKKLLRRETYTNLPLLLSEAVRFMR